VRELQSDSDIDDDVGRIIAEEKRRRRTSATKCEWKSVQFQFDDEEDEDNKDEEVKTKVASETTSVPALVAWWVRS